MLGAQPPAHAGRAPAGANPAADSGPRGATSDLVAGFVVFLIALPLSLGIALASGAPAVAGVLAAAVGGLVPPLLGQAPITIKGPAAGLIAIVLAAITELGDGDLELGYRRFLAVALVAAVVQLALAWRGAARLSVAMPPTVIAGMLAAIGVTILAKQIHGVLGVTPTAQTPLLLLMEVPASVARVNPMALCVGATCIAILWGWPRIAGAARRLDLRVPLAALPAPLLAVAAAVALAQAWDFARPHEAVWLGRSIPVGPELLLALPESLAAALVTPDFAVLRELRAYGHVLALALVGSLESVLSVRAVDALDPTHRRSDVSRDLLAVGAANLASAAIGGLPVISEIVRSKANLDAGARTSRANFVHGVLVLGAVALFPAALQQVPLAALAALLIVTAGRLAAPRQLARARAIGWDQLVVFLTTLGVTLAVDLLVGLAAGVAVELLHLAWRSGGLRPLVAASVQVTPDPEGAGVTEIGIHGAATFLMIPRLESALWAGRSAGHTRIRVHVDRAPVLDHSLQACVRDFAARWPAGRVEWVGLAPLRALSADPLACRYAAAGSAGS